jgi:iron complex transport system substrate-binding protein
MSAGEAASLTAMALRTFIVLFTAALLIAAPALAGPKRIVSLNLCADQFLMVLADRGQIAALTQFARDPQVSAGAARAATLPVARGGAEEVLALRPDLVIANPYLGPEILGLLARHRIPVAELPEANDFPGIIDSVRRIAAVTGHPDRGEALITRMRARLARIGPPPGRGRVAAYYQRRGFVTGTGTLVDDLMRRVGLVNLAERARLPVLARLPVERMIVARPDFLLLEQDRRHGEDAGSELLNHPALARAFPPARRLEISQALTVCGNPDYPQAVEQLAAQIRAADRGR